MTTHVTATRDQLASVVGGLLEDGHRLALVAAHGLGGEAALETPMGCGFGACLGCAVPRPDGRFALCCQDGPVFAFSEVAW